MNKTWSILFLSCLTACSSPSSPDAGTASDTGGSGSPLAGQWSNPSCTSFSEAVAPCDMTLTFGADGTYETTTSYVKDPASTTGLAGCTMTTTFSGYRYTATPTTVSVMQASASVLVTRNGCMNAADDQPTPTMPADANPASIVFTDQPYTVSGNTLMIGGQTFTRR